MKVGLDTIKNWFKTGDKPSQQQFYNVFDSFFHKDDVIAANKVDKLDELLGKKADKEVLLGFEQSKQGLRNQGVISLNKDEAVKLELGRLEQFYGLQIIHSESLQMNLIEFSGSQDFEADYLGELTGGLNDMVSLSFPNTNEIWVKSSETIYVMIITYYGIPMTRIYSESL